MTKIVKYFLLCILIMGFFACKQGAGNKRLITVTIEPQKYFVEQLADSLFTVDVMVPAGTSPETYDPSPVQMAELANSTAYFSIGHIGFEQQWLQKIRENNPALPVFDTSKGIKLIGNNEDTDNHIGHEPEVEGEHTHSHHHGIDPHTWSSPKGALIIVRNMFQALVSLDPSNEPVYNRNLMKLEGEIARTDSIITALLEKAESRSFIIYHPALSYLAEDYGLTQYCIEIDGKEPSPAQLKELIDMVRKTGTRVVFIQQEFDRKNAEVIAKETGCRLVVIDPLSYYWSEQLIRIAKAIAHD